MVSKAEKGTQFEPKQTQQRSYFLPPGLGDFYRDVCNGNPSTGIRGAMIIDAALADAGFAHLRDAAVRAAANMDFPKATEKIKAMLIEEVGLRTLYDWLKDLPEGERAKLLAEARRKK